MNIFKKVALQGLKKNRTRTLVTIVGVMLSGALFTGVSTFAVSLQDYMIKGAADKYGGWHVELPEGDAEMAAQAEQDDRVAEVVSLQNLGYARLEDGKNENKPYLFLSGWDQKAFDTLPVKLISGRLPENSGEVLVPAHLAANGGVEIAVGDTISLAVGRRISGGKVLGQHDPFPAKEETLVTTENRTYTVVGICQRPAIEEFSAPGYTLVTTADTADADSLSVFITLKNPYQLHAYLKDLGADVDPVLNNDLLRFMGLSGEKTITILLFAICGILMALVVVGSVFLIYNAFHISLSERTHQFGILMSVGATARQLRGSVLFEGLCIGAVGIPLGILVGLPGIKLVLFLVEKNFKNVMYDNVQLELVVSAPAIAAAVVLSLVTILISAYIPARKAAGMPVMECIRQTNEIKVEAKKLKTSRLAQRLLGLEEMLALKNFKRNKQRYRSIILSLTFSVVLFVSASNFSSYLNQVGDRSVEVVENYDLVFSSDHMEESEMLQLYDELKDTDGVTASAYQADVTYPCRIDAGKLPEQFFDTFGEFLDYDGESQQIDAMLDAVFVDEGTYESLLKSLGLSEDEYNGQDDRIIMAGWVEGYLYMQEEPMQITLSSDSGDRVKNVRATFVSDYPDLLPAEAGSEFRGYSLMLIVPYEYKSGFDELGVTAASTLGMTFESDNPGGTKSQMKSILDASGITVSYSFYNLYEILEQNRNMEFVINLFAAVFTVMITLISIANVFNTISTNIRLRRRELAMLRSAGMSERGFNEMLRFECVLYGARTMLWSLPLSLLMTGLIYEGISAGADFEIRFIFPWESIGISILGVFLIVFITMLYAAGKVKKENIIDALRDEMT